jgi:hypothetical protein
MYGFQFTLTTAQAIPNRNILVSAMGNEGAFPRTSNAHHSNQNVIRLGLGCEPGRLFLHIGHIFGVFVTIQPLNLCVNPDEVDKGRTDTREV